MVQGEGRGQCFSQQQEDGAGDMHTEFAERVPVCLAAGRKQYSAARRHADGQTLLPRLVLLLL